MLSLKASVAKPRPSSFALDGEGKRTRRTAGDGENIRQAWKVGADKDCRQSPARLNRDFETSQQAQQINHPPLNVEVAVVLGLLQAGMARPRSRRPLIEASTAARVAARMHQQPDATNPLISSGPAKITSARSPIIPAPTSAGAPFCGPSGLESVLSRRLRSQSGVAYYRYTIPTSALSALAAMNKNLDERGRYDAVMRSDGLFTVEPEIPSKSTE